MNQAQELFEKLSSMKSSDEFLEYCSQILGGVERIHVDFKEKRDRRSSKPENDDKKNLAKAVSGFANSGGGVLIWGLEDKTLKPKPITDVQHFLQNILQLAPQITDPIVGKIDGNWILADADTKEGFGILLIPESELPPHRVILDFEGTKNHYFVRSGNSFVVASHTMLEDMFGRRPKPNLTLCVRVKHTGNRAKYQDFSFILGIENKGRGSAKSPFLDITVQEPYKLSSFGVDGNRHFGLPVLAGDNNTRHQRFGSSQSIVIHPGVAHDVTAINVELDISKLEKPPNLVIDYQIAAEGVYLINGQEVVNLAELPSKFNLQY